MDDFLKIIITAAATLVVGLVAALVGAALQARREQAKWLREQQIGVYSDFLGVAERMNRYISTDQVTMDLLEELFSRSAAVQVVGTTKAYVAAGEATLALSNSWMEMKRGNGVTNASRELAAFHVAARQSLGLKDR